MNELGNTPADKNYKPSRISRAEKAALKAYPVDMQPLVYQDLIEQFGGKTEIDVNTYPRFQFQKAYEQAEKDLALTWEDIRIITAIEREMSMEYVNEHPDWTSSQEIYYTEVLNRFNKSKEEQ